MIAHSERLDHEHSKLHSVEADALQSDQADLEDHHHQLARNDPRGPGRVALLHDAVDEGGGQPGNQYSGNTQQNAAKEGKCSGDGIPAQPVLEAAEQAWGRSAWFEVGARFEFDGDAREGARELVFVHEPPTTRRVIDLVAVSLHSLEYQEVAEAPEKHARTCGLIAKGR